MVPGILTVHIRDVCICREDETRVVKRVISRQILYFHLIRFPEEKYSSLLA